MFIRLRICGFAAFRHGEYLTPCWILLLQPRRVSGCNGGLVELKQAGWFFFLFLHRIFAIGLANHGLVIPPMGRSCPSESDVYTSRRKRHITTPVNGVSSWISMHGLIQGITLYHTRTKIHGSLMGDSDKVLLVLNHKKGSPKEEWSLLNMSWYTWPLIPSEWNLMIPLKRTRNVDEARPDEMGHRLHLCGVILEPRQDFRRLPQVAK